MAEQKEHWAIERKIPIALLTAFAAQIVEVKDILRQRLRN